MESTQRTQPNSLLRQLRLLRGWSLEHVVKELCSLCQEDDDVPGVSADMVGNWERGERKPSRFYQTKLCLLYNTTADQLGFMEEALDGTNLPTDDIHSTISHSLSLSDVSVNTQTSTPLVSGEQAEVSDILATNL